MIGDKNGCWYSYSERGEVVDYEFFCGVQVWEIGCATLESMMKRFEAFCREIDAGGDSGGVTKVRNPVLCQGNKTCH